jgi:hypothetical protein
MLALTATLDGGKKVDGASVYMKVETLQAEYERSEARKWATGRDPHVEETKSLDLGPQERKEPTLEGSTPEGPAKAELSAESGAPSKEKEQGRSAPVAESKERTSEPSRERQMEREL